jgi:hypothetical protein
MEYKKMAWKLEIGSTTPMELLDPNWQQILGVLHSLDGGKSFDLVSLTLSGKGTLTAGGGDNGRYLVVYFPVDHPDTPSLTLTDSHLAGPPVYLTIQTPDEHEARHAIMFPLVVQVFEDFFQTRHIPKDVHWEIDNTGEEAASSFLLKY